MLISDRTAFIWAAVLIANLAGVVVTAGDAANVAEARKLFDSLYGNELRAAKATAGFDDDLALAKNLLSAVGELKEHPKLVGLICDEAYELTAGRPEGYEMAVLAAETLQTQVESRQIDALDMLATVHRKAYLRVRGDDKADVALGLVDVLAERGRLQELARDFQGAAQTYRQAAQVARGGRLEDADALLVFQKRAQQQHALHQRVNGLEEQLLRNAGSAKVARQLALIYLIELDKPDEAKRVTAQSDDKPLVEIVELLLQPIENLDEEALSKLGEWYRQQAKTVAGQPQYMANKKASAYYRRYLDNAKGEALTHAKAKLALRRLETDIARYEKVHGGGDAFAPRARPITASDRLKTLPKKRWVEFISYLKPDRHSSRLLSNPALWIKGGKNGPIFMNRPPPRPTYVYGLNLPVDIDGYYDFRARFKAPGNAGIISFLGPKPQRGFYIFEYGIQGKKDVKMIEGDLMVSTNPGPNGTVKIEMWINGELYRTRHETIPAFEPNARPRTRPRHLGIRAEKMQVSFDSLMVRMRDGKSKFIPDADWPDGQP